MTEEEWEACTEPNRMLSFLRERVSPRKRRLLECALSRSVWQELSDGRSRKAVETAEAFADGRVSTGPLRRAADHARQARNEMYMAFVAARRAAGGEYPRHVEEALARADASEAAAWAAGDEPLGFRDFEGTPRGGPLDSYDNLGAMYSLMRKHHYLVAELFGNPFRPPQPLSPSLLAWSDGLVVKMATTIYEERSLPSGHLDGDRLAVLADALEEVGADAFLIEHLRGPGPHVRGCHVVDLLTGRE